MINGSSPKGDSFSTSFLAAHEEGARQSYRLNVVNGWNYTVMVSATTSAGESPYAVYSFVVSGKFTK